MEVSVDTHLSHRKNLAGYLRAERQGVTLLVAPELARAARAISIDLKQFLFLRNLKAIAQLSSGLMIGQRNNI